MPCVSSVAAASLRMPVLATPNAPTRRVFQGPPPINGVPALTEEPASIYADYCRDWMRAFLQLAMDNVGYEGGREITAEQNERLGAILRAVAA